PGVPFPARHRVPFAVQGLGDLVGGEPVATQRDDPRPQLLIPLQGRVPAEDKAKFDKLAKVLQEQPSGIKVYKVGDEAEKDVYIVGKTKDGQWAGLKTTVVET